MTCLQGAHSLVLTSSIQGENELELKTLWGSAGVWTGGDGSFQPGNPEGLRGKGGIVAGH